MKFGAGPVLRKQKTITAANGDQNVEFKKKVVEIMLEKHITREEAEKLARIAGEEWLVTFTIVGFIVLCCCVMACIGFVIWAKMKRD